MCYLDPRVQNLARWLNAREATADSPDDAAVLAVVRVSEKLRGPLSTLAGAAGYRALVSRALALAKAEAPSLGTFRVRDDGCLDAPVTDGPQPDTDETTRGYETLVARLLALLVTFIGAGLTMQLVRDVWPDAPFDGMDSKTEKL